MYVGTYYKGTDMSYLTPFATTSEYGVVQIGSGISVANGVISTTNSSSSTNVIVGTWTPAIGDLLTVAAASGNAGKLVQLDPAAVQTDGIAVGRVDSYDSAAGLLYFTQLSAV
jgi:hypothetical protein